jgi:cardiolipin synthase
MLLVVPRKHSPTAATAWLLLIFLMPVIGVVFYWLIARDLLAKRRMKQHQRMLDELSQMHRELSDRMQPTRISMDEAVGPVAALAEKLGRMPILCGNAARLYGDDEEVLDRLIEDIEAAEDHIHMVFYIWENDPTGLRLADALIEASRRGVDCRVLMDSVGSHNWFRRRKGYFAGTGVEVRAALPVGLFRRSVSRLDLRNHRKIVVIDGRVGWTGSQNILDPVGRYRRGKFKDMMVRLRGPIVLELQHVFRSDWYFETDELLEEDQLYPEIEQPGDAMVQALPSGPNYPVENYQRIVVDALHSARESAVMTTPYFVPDEALLQAMQVASLRGTQVQLILPRSSDHVLVDAAAHSYFDFLLQSGVEIYQYDAGVLHAKALTIDDDLALVGSGNFDIRSFALNFELNLIFAAPGMVKSVRELQKTYIRNARRLTQETWDARPTLRRYGQNMAKLLSPLL